MTLRDPKFAALYTQHGAHVWRMARHFGVGHDQLDDITQDVWLSILDRVAELDLSCSPRAWLTAVVWNHVRHARRGHARRTRKVEALALVETLRRVDEPAIVQKEAGWTLERLLADLPEEQRQVLLLCDGEGLTAPEVSEALGINPNTVSSRLRLARRRCEALAAGGAAIAALLREHCAAMDPSPGQFDAMLYALVDAPTSSRLSSTTGAGKLKFVAAMFVVTAGCFVIASTWSRSVDDAAARVEAPVTPAPAAVLASAPAPTPPEWLAPRFTPDRPRPAPARRRPTRQRVERGPAIVAASDPAAQPQIPSLAAEHRILAAAEAALARGYTDQALAHLGEHRRDFPRGANAEARDLLRIRTYCARQNHERARQVALEREHDPQFAALAAKPCD